MTEVRDVEREDEEEVLEGLLDLGALIVLDLWLLLGGAEEEDGAVAGLGLHGGLKEVDL